MQKKGLYLIALSIAVLTGFPQHGLTESDPSIPVRSATVRMEVRDNRVFIPLEVAGPNGKTKVVLFWVDSGGDTIFLSGQLAHELGLQESGASFMGMGETPSHFVTKPHLSIMGMDIDLTRVSVSASLSEKSRNAFAGVEAGGFLPATVLRNYEAVFDYPAHSFTLAQTGNIAHRGMPVPMAIQPTTGFARVEIAIGGQDYGFMLDTGAAYTGISRTVIDRWIGKHPSWPHSLGAVGAANMVGKHFDATNELLRIPEIKWGSILLRNVGMVSRPAGVYEKVVSEDMTAPIVGALSGNVLRQFRLDLDYPAGIAYLELDGADSISDLDCVGLIVQVGEDGNAIVSGVAQRDGRAEIAGVEAGDILLRVDDHEVAGASLATILTYLSGAVGEKKRLTLRRDARELSVSAVVFPHP